MTVLTLVAPYPFDCHCEDGGGRPHLHCPWGGAGPHIHYADGQEPPAPAAGSA
jgi:hypothetical protein